MSDCSADYFKY